MRTGLFLLLLALSAPPCRAQVFLGAEVGPDAFVKAEPAQLDNSSEDAFAWALSSEVSSSTLYAVLESTTPERELLRYLGLGIYRQELAALLLLSEKSSVPVKKLAEELPKAGGFRGLAKKHKADAMAIFSEAGRLKAAADLRLPLFLPVSPPPAAVETSTAAPPSPDEKK
ncbi:MAG TPA: hypothetical protein DEQ38_01760 [Elusimicrobia bacterium]|nr:MAG: hypothetical protein A2089_07335 [Elusimicrobia bacterium GWD2_63_28]HCC46834.1 hypothetical protein [Elusimicrobiota bacterium]